MPKVQSEEAKKKISEGMKKRYSRLRRTVEAMDRQLPDRTICYLCAEFGYVSHEKGKSIEQTMMDLQVLLTDGR